MFHGNIHRHLLTLSLANWVIAIVCWTISAYLGIARPTDLIVYTVLFVIGLFALIVAVVAFVLADFGTEPGQPALAAATANGAPEAGAPGVAEIATVPAGAPSKKPADTPAAKPAEKTAEAPADTPSKKPADTPSKKPADTPAAKPAEKTAEAPADKAGSGA